MRLALIISSMRGGGAERVMSIMANYWAAKGWPITVITFEGPETDFYKLSPSVERRTVGKVGRPASRLDAMRTNLWRLRRIRHFVREAKPDAVISFIDQMNVFVMLATRGLKIPVVVSERVDPRYYSIGAFSHRLRTWLYPHAAGLVVQTESVRQWAETHTAPKRVHIIPNPVRPIDAGGRADRSARQKRIVAMGRFDRQKGFDILLRAFARCRANGMSGWKLMILGDGHERPNLEALIAELKLQELVEMPGRVQDPETILCDSEIFVLSSRFEGFPNALIEAMACGMAVVSFNCPSGPTDIIADGENGLLVPLPDEAKLADAISKLTNDDQLRQNLGAHAAEIVNRYALEKVMAQWENVLSQVS